MHTRTPRPKPTGIVAGKAYPKPEFLIATGWGEKAFRVARDRGLKVRKESRYLYILGDDFIEYLKSRQVATV